MPLRLKQTVLSIFPAARRGLAQDHLWKGFHRDISTELANRNLKMTNLCLRVNGIGRKAALGIMSQLPGDNFRVVRQNRKLAYPISPF
jgi:hypothetical protein